MTAVYSGRTASKTSMALARSPFAEHQSLAQRFTRSGEVALTPEQLRTLRSLGYIR